MLVRVGRSHRRGRQVVRREAERGATLRRPLRDADPVRVDVLGVERLISAGRLFRRCPADVNRDLGKVKGTLFGRAFWSRGYCVSTVGLDEAMIKSYIQDQEKHEREQERGLFD